MSAALPASATPEAGSQWDYRLRFQLPFLGASEVVRSNATPTPARTPVRETWEIPILGLSLATDVGRRWTFELGAGLVATSGGLRAAAATRGGPIFTLVDRRRPDGVGSRLQLALLAELAHRGHAYHIIAEGGQRTLSFGAAAGLEYTYFTSTDFGWSVRARPGLSYAVWQQGESIWTDEDEGLELWADGYLMKVGIHVELGMVF